MEEAVGNELTLKPIGVFRSNFKNPYDLPRQPDEATTISCIELLPQQNFEQALDSLEQFDRIWVIYQFHHNSNWKPMTLPPRGTDKKIGVFATRSPYRPNPLGLSCLRLIKIEGLRVWVEGADLMDETPILDLKPYVPQHDAFPDASMGWLENIDQARWRISLAEKAESQLRWLRENGEDKIETFLRRQLEYDPINSSKKRVQGNGDHFTLSYRTWRVSFSLDEEKKEIQVLHVYSGYSEAELSSTDDPYKDKELHRQFFKSF